MNCRQNRLGMVLKGYPRISETFISTEILLLESLGIPIDIYSLKQPRESFSHEYIKKISATVTYLPEYVLPRWKEMLESNVRLWRCIGWRYMRCLAEAAIRAVERRKAATLRHFLQAGCLALQLRQGGVAHLHAHFCHTPTSVAFFASRLTGLPFSFTAHAKDIYTSEPDQLRRKIRSARFVVTCTEYNARYLQSLSDGRTPIHTVYHGIDLGFFSFGVTAPAGPPYKILSVGRLVPKKGYDDLVRAMKLLDEAGLDFEWVHIGSGEEELRIRALVHLLGLEHKVRMLGTLPREDVVGHLRDAHCFALACKVAENGDRDGIPNVLAEAMAVGVPVVTTRVSAIPELIEDGVTGVLVEPGDPADMARAILDVLLHPEDCRDLRTRARAGVERDFDNRRNVGRLNELFRRALRGQGEQW